VAWVAQVGTVSRSLPIPRLKRSERAISVHPIQVVIAGVVIAGAFFCIRFTLGRHIVAVGGNEEAARLAGIRGACEIHRLYD